MCEISNNGLLTDLIDSMTLNPDAVIKTTRLIIDLERRLGRMPPSTNLEGDRQLVS
jgi:hypothetical protein